MNDLDVENYSLASDSWGNEEIEAINDVVKSNRFTMGEKVKTFEAEFSKYFSVNHALMLNSGSSANLLALSSFNFKKGSEIITPTLTFSTTVSPIYQVGCIPYFIDVDKFSFLSNLNQIEKAINKKTVANIIQKLLGNI